MNQTATILDHLLSGKTITPIDALKFGCFRLAARIGELRERGHDIKTTIIHDGGSSFAQYSLQLQPSFQLTA
tara:strand:+ start:425 stop:640 length:216 start_codon:yes stop_codon:yes gene_type:complete